MKSETFTFKTSDGTNIFTYKWMPDDASSVRGIVQIAHGMAEHAARYERFAGALTQGGYAVYANDHRGHGKTAGSQEDIGFFADENGWGKVIEDMHTLTGIIQKECPGKPVVLFGHSMGSFLSRHYSMHYADDLSGLVLSGTGGDPGVIGKIGLFIAKMDAKLKGKKAKSEIMNKLSFGNFNSAFKPNRTDYDWLSRDSAEVDKYIKDPWCGAVFTAGFFCDMLEGIGYINKKENIAKISKKLPIYIFSGAKDPVGANTKGVSQVYNAFKKVNIEDVEVKFYKDGRHEMLNEINSDEVFKDVIAWLDKHIT
ncbi:lysophospholipase [hydrocarbon metagenome]|uniref:Lysophospholipase n=1 Tax=hydrocarbon metagenome TaxID=938273 RepID=A0A0W8FNQ5_9ZZZZ